MNPLWTCTTSWLHGARAKPDANSSKGIALHVILLKLEAATLETAQLYSSIRDSFTTVCNITLGTQTCIRFDKAKVLTNLQFLN